MHVMTTNNNMNENVSSAVDSTTRARLKVKSIQLLLTM